MSYASETKKLICEKPSGDWCCKLAELAGLLCFGSTYKNGSLKIKSESQDVFERLLNITDDVTDVLKQKITIPKSEGGRYILTLNDKEEILRLCDCVGFNLTDTSIEFVFDDELLENDCCKTSFIRGAFLSGGSLSDPERNYHLEFVCKYAKPADKLFELLESININSRLTVRKNNFVIYIKEFEAIANILGLLGAGSKMMDLYNLKIEKELRNEVNRVVNCDSANIKKITAAAETHLNAINKIIEAGALDLLPDTLSEIAHLRLEHPSASLDELGKLLKTPIGKSGVNHRLNRLVEFSKNIDNA